MIGRKILGSPPYSLVEVPNGPPGTHAVIDDAGVMITTIVCSGPRPCFESFKAVVNQLRANGSGKRGGGPGGPAGPAATPTAMKRPQTPPPLIATLMRTEERRPERRQDESHEQPFADEPPDDDGYEPEQQPPTPKIKGPGLR